MAIIAARACRVKDVPSLVVDPASVERACREAGHRWRDRTLGPCATLRALVTQIANGNTAMTELTRIMGGEFSPSAYCQARQRLPTSVVRAVLDDFTSRARSTCDDRSGLWRGHRTALMDGTGVVMPDTPELRSFFGVASGYAPGCGLPLAHVLTLFDAHHGLLLDMAVDPGSTQDLRRAHDLHPALREGDVVVGDRGLCAYTHLAALAEKGMHGVFRVGKTRATPFPAGNGPRQPNTYNRHSSSEPVLVDLIGPDDQLIDIVKPHHRPKYLDPERFAKVPSTMLVRAIRYRVEQPGFRSREIVLLTTLLDPQKYPAKEVAALYQTRWRIEQNIRHLKRTLGMERLKCRSKDGVERELAVFALVYNAVCVVRTLAARAQKVDPIRVSFLDTLRSIRHAARGASVAIDQPSALLVLPKRSPRIHPRQRKRSDSPFPIMRRPRSAIIKGLLTSDPPRN
jgi:hypothetical protein